MMILKLTDWKYVILDELNNLILTNKLFLGHLYKDTIQIVSNLLNSLKNIFMISYQFMPNNVRFIRNPRLFIKESIPKLILTQHSSTTPN